MTDEAVSLKIDDNKVFERLNELSKRCKDLSPLMRRITHCMHDETEENFKTEGANAGDKWAGWSKNWKAKRAQMGKGQGRILQLNAELKNSISREATSQSAAVGTNKKYAAIHNFGGEIKHPGGVKFLFIKDKFTPLKKDAKRFMGVTKPTTITMPKRPFFVITENLKQRITSEVHQELFSKTGLQ